MNESVLQFFWTLSKGANGPENITPDVRHRENRGALRGSTYCTPASSNPPLFCHTQLCRYSHQTCLAPGRRGQRALKITAGKTWPWNRIQGQLKEMGLGKSSAFNSSSAGCRHKSDLPVLPITLNYVPPSTYHLWKRGSSVRCQFCYCCQRGRWCFESVLLVCLSAELFRNCRPPNPENGCSTGQGRTHRMLK